MKKNVLLGLIGLAGVLISCQKEDLTRVENPKIESEVTKNSHDESVESQIAYGIKNLPNDELLQLWFNPETGKVDWDVLPTKNYKNSTYKAEHECTGSAYSVAKCAKAIIDAGGCVIAGSTDGELWADKIDCP
jgi:hypothetical protein